MGLQPKSIPLDSLLLDPNNFRFLDDPDFQRAEAHRFHEASVQDRANRRLRNDELRPLKRSILTNGYMEIERIVVRRYDSPEDKFLVLEGNRRLAALRWIKADYDSGIDVPEGVLATLDAVPCLVASGEDLDSSFYDALMGVRHVSGIKAWGGFQEATLVKDLADEHGLDPPAIADRLGMHVRDVNRRYRAIKALEQMADDEEFGGFATADRYPVFHEAVSLPKVRDWLGWNGEASRFTNSEALEDFYSLISPGETESGEPREAKLPTYQQVRQLKDILGHPEAVLMLTDPDRSFFNSLTNGRTV
jgi:hypothetical protein